MAELRITRAMVLAAGLGTRLRPMTDHLAKPMIPVLGRPLLDHIVDRLAEAGVTDIVLNTHHRPETIQDWAAAREASPRLELVHEPEILGTGGALANVRDKFADCEAFLLHNGDVWSDVDCTALAREHTRSGAMITLLLIDHPKINTVLMGVGGAIKDIGGLLGVEASDGDRSLTYSGVAVVSHRFLERLPPGSSNLADAMAAAVAEIPSSVHGYAPRRSSWSDLGTPRSYLNLHGLMLAGDDEVMKGRDVQIDAGAEIAGFCMLGDGCSIGAEVTLEDCIVMPGVRIEGPADYCYAVLGDGWVMSGHSPQSVFDESLRPFLDASGLIGAEVSPLNIQGSDRGFWRCSTGKTSAVLMDSRGDPSEFDRGLGVAEFLYGVGLGGVRVLARHPSLSVVLQDDCGDLTLKRSLSRQPEAWRDLYSKVLKLLAGLQSAGTQAALAGACPEACDRRFVREDLLAETTYFRKRYLTEHCGLPNDRLAGLDKEFEVLAEVVAAQQSVLMHRDFQSTNILFQNDRIRLVDVQGMRLGPRGYDVASLLRDPYVNFQEDRIALLLEDWCAAVTERDPEVDPVTLRRDFVLAGLQRNMQALGAYAFLSRKKGRGAFVRWFTPGLNQLAAGLSATKELWNAPPLPILSALVAELIEDDVSKN